MVCKLSFFFCDISLFGNSVIRCKTCHNKPNSFSPLNNEVVIYLGFLDSSRDAKLKNYKQYQASNNISVCTFYKHSDKML